LQFFHLVRAAFNIANTAAEIRAARTKRVSVDASRSPAISLIIRADKYMPAYGVSELTAAQTAVDVNIAGYLFHHNL
jgi:hypothetical protein